MKKKVSVSAPFRISIAGGGTDIPEIFKKIGGNFISAAIDKRIYIVVETRNDEIVKVIYEAPDKIENQTYKFDDVPGLLGCITNQFHFKGLDISIKSPIKCNSGLGGSGVLSVCLVAALSSLSGVKIDSYNIAIKAYDIERNGFGSPIGYQDQLITALGGLIKVRISKESIIELEDISTTLKDNLNYILIKNTLLISVNKQRAAKNILADFKAKASSDMETLNEMIKIASLLQPIEEAIQDMDVKKLGNLFNTHWNIKRNLSESMSNNNIDALYQKILDYGSYGGKLIGAGGGGYIIALFEENQLNEVKEKLGKDGYECISISVDAKGLKVYSYKMKN